MKAVVTGATSFLGVAMIQKLLQKGLEVYAVVRPASLNLAKVPKGAHRIELELESLDRIDEYIKEPCEIFLHFGWDGSGSQNRLRSDVQRKNVVDSMKALEGAGKLGCKRFLFSGSQAEYGMSQTLMTEDMTCHPVSEYGKAKLAFYEQAHRRCQAWREAG
ncbi:MAG: NAD-dependent epimerase/dehydratase family protein, partial [Hungatella sp.]